MIALILMIDLESLRALTSMESDIVSGQETAWVLLKKLGEGDAGEVFLVESLLEKRAAILKRPGKSAFASDIVRQTAQITTEQKIIRALSAMFDMEPDFGLRTPHLLDQSKPGAAFSDRLFIILEQAPGFDLGLLARTARMGLFSGAETQAATPEERRFLQTLSEISAGGQGGLPARIVLSALHALLDLFARIHAHPFDVDGAQAHGILWNDVKPEHLFWDPRLARLTIIDWGNGQFLEIDGATKDRRFTLREDYRQFIEEMGRFLENSAPHLLTQLEWPERGNPEAYSSPAIAALHERIQAALQQELTGLNETRRRERDVLRGETALENPLAELEAVHRQIIGYGELPDYPGALRFALEQSNQMVAQERAGHDRIERIGDLCEWAVGLPGSNTSALQMIAHLARVAGRSTAPGGDPQRIALREAVAAALQADWTGMLWSLVSALRGAPEPPWWAELVSTIRQLALGSEVEDEVQPLRTARRTLLTLQSMLERLREQPGGNESLEHLQSLVRHLRAEIIPNWLSIDPPPPFSGLAYSDIEEILPEIGAFLPEGRDAILRALDLPRAQVQRVLHHWQRGEFEAARGELHRLLMLDPDRKRVLHAEQALLDVPEWLASVQAGPQDGEHYQRFVTDMEFTGRELRNQIGPAGWLDLILDGCRQLRRGVWPPDLFTTLPLLVQEMPWLARFERRERLPQTAGANGGQPAGDAALPGSGAGFPAVSGVTRGTLGPEQDLQLLPPLDGWIAEARGSSARVFGGLLRDEHSQLTPAAIKLMRMDKVDYALPLFREEVLVLNALRDVPGVTPLLECGYLKIENDGNLPSERETSIDPTLAGSLIRISPRAGQDFINQLDMRIGEGWTPYLAIEQRDPRHNLLALCDAGLTAGRFRPVTELLLIAIQICEILAEAHNRNIVYRDHKILHYYWLEEMRGVFVIDWNVARLHPDGLSEYDKQMDLVQFGARALHHILTGRTAPGALPLGPTRPEEIEAAAKSYQAQWTYDDQRLPEDLREILERVLAGEYNNATHLRDALKAAFLQLPDLSFQV